MNIVKRIIALADGELSSACWCFCGASGRAESLTRHAPQLVLISEDESGRLELLQKYERVSDALTACDYLAPAYPVVSASPYVLRSTWGRTSCAPRIRR